LPALSTTVNVTVKLPVAEYVVCAEELVFGPCDGGLADGPPKSHV
jgi:hypothetical protein